MKIERLAGNIGATISDVDVATCSDQEVADLRQALLTHKAIFLRDQRLTYESQVAFGRRLGELTAGHPIFKAPTAKPYLREFDSRHGIRANHWHTDLTFLERPPAIALLHCVVAPMVGGDTLWANSAVAYATLPDDLRTLVDRVRIVHSNDCDYIDDTLDSGRLDYISVVYETEHAAVQVHPETKERILVVGGFAKRVVGLSSHASRDLLRLLQDHATKPEHTTRWRWKSGDLAIWDNMATQHYAIYDYGSAHRRMERVTVAGPIPMGIDGGASKMVRGPA